MAAIPFSIRKLSLRNHKYSAYLFIKPNLISNITPTIHNRLVRGIFLHNPILDIRIQYNLIRTY